MCFQTHSHLYLYIHILVMLKKFEFTKHAPACFVNSVNLLQII